MKKVSFTIDVDCGIGDKFLRNGKTIYPDDALISQGYEKAIFRFFEFLESIDAKGTLFIVSSTNNSKGNTKILREAVDLGHEIASHTSLHKKDFGMGTYKDILKELKDSKHSLEDTIGQDIIGFRAPGYYINQKMYDGLFEAGYNYSSSINPSLIYNLLKFGASLIEKISKSGNVEYPTNLQSIFKSCSPSVVKEKRSKHVSKNNSNQFIEIPVSCDRLHMIPSICFFHDMIMPTSLSNAYISHISGLNHSTFVFHDFEFLTQKEIPSDRMPFATDMSIKKNHKRIAFFNSIKHNFLNHEKCTLRNQMKDF